MIKAQPAQEANAQSSVIIVEVIGFGGGAEDDEKAKKRTDSGRQSYNPNSNVQVLGFATLSDAQTSGLTDDEARAIRH